MRGAIKVGSTAKLIQLQTQSKLLSAQKRSAFVCCYFSALVKVASKFEVCDMFSANARGRRRRRRIKELKFGANSRNEQRRQAMSLKDKPRKANSNCKRFSSKEALICGLVLTNFALIVCAHNAANSATDESKVSWKSNKDWAQTANGDVKSSSLLSAASNFDLCLLSARSSKQLTDETNFKTKTQISKRTRFERNRIAQTN